MYHPNHSIFCKISARQQQEKKKLTKVVLLKTITIAIKSEKFTKSGINKSCPLITSRLIIFQRLKDINRFTKNNFRFSSFLFPFLASTDEQTKPVTSGYATKHESKIYSSVAACHQRSQHYRYTRVNHVNYSSTRLIEQRPYR